MDLVIHKPVTVITPTIGKIELNDAIRSVGKQTYPCKHLIVFDNPKGVKAFEKENNPPNDPIDVCFLPYNTGADGFYGHRIYAAFPHLVNSDYILFLDEDNFYEPDHVATLIKTIEDNNLQFAYSLRRIVDKDGKYLCDDNCESLGQWPIFFTHDNPQYLVDTSSFCFRREFLIQVCQFWHFGWGGDRRFFEIVKKSAPHDTTGKHTLNYRLDGNPNSVTKEFFEEGNKQQLQIYGGDLPWLRT